VIRDAVRAIASVAIIVGWFAALTWLALSVSQIAVGRVSLPNCVSDYPPKSSLSAPELNRVLVREMTRC
jgi:hypothetical protein